MSDWLTPPQVAARLNVSSRTVERWCDRDGLPHDRRGCIRMINEVVLADWLAKHPEIVSRSFVGSKSMRRVMTQGTRVYLAGPMTGLRDNNIPAFDAAALKLRELGYVVVSPADHETADSRPKWSDAMRRDLPLLVSCEVVAVLPGAVKSRGASLELHVARELGMAIYEVGELIGARP